MEALARAVETQERSAAEVRLEKLALELVAQPQEARRARVGVVRARAAEAVVDLEAREAKPARAWVVRARAVETAAEREGRPAKQAPEQGAKQVWGRAANQVRELAEQWPLAALAARPAQSPRSSTTTTAPVRPRSALTKDGSFTSAM